MKNIKKICLVFLFTIFATTNIFALGKWINMDLKYDDKVHKYSAEEINIEIDGEKIKNFNMPPIIIEGRTLVPLRDIFEHIDARIEWDKDTREIFVQKDGIDIVFQIDNKQAVKNFVDIIELDVAPKIINGYTMLPLRAISDSIGYNVSWDNTTRTVKIDTNVESTTETTTQVITESTTEITTQAIQNNQTGSIKLVWDQTSKATNDLPAKRIPIDGLNVISPTWFAIKNSQGDVEDKGSIEYSKWAKEQGYQIWALVSNSFDKKITHDTLSSKEKRKKIIDTLVSYAKKYNLDGINIDFESVDKKDGDYYLQFIKEATPIFKANNLIVSVDMYVPTPWTEHYQMEEVGKIVDYVIIMAYDEHYSTSPESGSVASLPWTEKYMTEATKLVDKDKLIMGIPFYTRVWTETKKTDGKVSVVSKSLRMDEAKKLLEDNNAKVFWDEQTRQYYGEYYSNGTTKKIWLEDASSIEERMKVAKKLGIKGVAAWKRGHETDDIWPVINKYF